MKTLNIFFDIEVYQYNEQIKNTRPQYLKNEVYAVYLISEETYRKHTILHDKIFPNFSEFFRYIDKNIHAKRINLIAHNGRRYDFHYLKKYLDETKVHSFNKYVRNSLQHDNETTLKNINYADYYLEQHIKSKTSIDLSFNFRGKIYQTLDSFPKFQTSIKVLGELLHDKKLIDKTDEKRKYDYDYFNLKEDFSVFKAKEIALNYYNNLDENDIKYIRNDTYILYMAFEHYNKIFPNFDISKMTLSQNILSGYLTSLLAEYQLLRNYKGASLGLTSFKFNDKENLYNHIREFYRGGLNLYNDKYIEKIVKKVFHIDINSSYPHSLATDKFPTYLIEHKQSENFEEYEMNVSNLKDDNFYYLITINVNEFNNILKHIQSKIVRKIFVKRFTGKVPLIHIDSVSLLEMFKFTNLETFKYTSYLKYETRKFASADEVLEHYETKVNAKKRGLSKYAVYVFKVMINGIYGIPALRPYFDIFKKDETGEFYNTKNGFKNTERNLLFATAVTSFAFRNLMKPLNHIPFKEIDDNVLYFDTDSIFMKKKALKLFKGLEFDDYKLGAWAVEHENIDNFYILNHKKYVFDYFDKKKNKQVISVVAGGIKKDMFDINMPLKDFIKTQFTSGVKIKSVANILTRSGTMAIYDRDTLLEKGHKYPDKIDFDVYLKNLIQREKIKEEIKENQNITGVSHNPLYYESTTQVLSDYDLYEVDESVKNCFDLDVLVSMDKRIKKGIEDKKYVNIE